MHAEPAQRRIDALADRYALSARQRAQLERVLALLASQPRAPTSVRCPERAVDTHIADSLVALELDSVRAAGAIADLGSGAGFPGVPLAVALEHSEVYLVESQAGKCLYLERTIAELGLANAQVVHARAEEWSAGGRENDVAIARALGSQALVLEYAAPLLRRGGLLVDWRGARSREEDQRAMRACEQLGMRLTEIRSVAPFLGARNHHLHLYLKVKDTPPGFPRRAGVARRRPLA
jgi:16S rRNA (guanine527-N7)-methyltransferase